MEPTTSNFLSLKTPEGIIRVPTFRISHFILYECSVKMIFSDGKYQKVSESMKAVEEASDKNGFFRIHQNFIVNLGQELHLNIKTRELTLITGEKIIVAKDRLKQIKELLSV